MTCRHWEVGRVGGMKWDGGGCPCAQHDTPHRPRRLHNTAEMHSYNEILCLLVAWQPKYWFIWHIPRTRLTLHFWYLEEGVFTDESGRCEREAEQELWNQHQENRGQNGSERMTPSLGDSYGGTQQVGGALQLRLAKSQQNKPGLFLFWTLQLSGLIWLSQMHLFLSVLK